MHSIVRLRSQQHQGSTFGAIITSYSNTHGGRFIVKTLAFPRRKSGCWGFLCIRQSRSTSFVRIMYSLRPSWHQQHATYYIHTRTTALYNNADSYLQAQHTLYEESEEFVPVTLRRLSRLMYGVNCTEFLVLNLQLPAIPRYISLPFGSRYSAIMEVRGEFHNTQ